MIRVGVLGATGYTGLELIKLLLRHPQVEITTLTSRQEGEPHVATVHPSLHGRLDLRLRNLSPSEVAAEADCVFCCLPHAASASSVKALLDCGARVVDFSADYRLDDIETYSQWYKVEHPDADRVGKVVYGLPELFASQLPEAALVANPGCFPTSAILAAAPFLKGGRIDPRDLIFDSKTGVSGAGRNPKLSTHFPECNESVAAYSVGQHRHMPEIDQVLRRFTGEAVESLFTPHLIPMDRGILTTMYARPVTELGEEEAIETLRAFYRDMPFVRVFDELPSTKATSGTNYCDITARVTRGRLVVISCLDNLVKGASGAAVQNFNLMFGCDETTALLGT